MEFQVIVMKTINLLFPFILLFCVLGCKDAIVTFDNESCTESIIPTNLPQQQNFYTKDWILYQTGSKSTLQEADTSVKVSIRFNDSGVGTVKIVDTSINTPDTTIYNFTYRFCKTSCNCSLLRFYTQSNTVGVHKSIVDQVFTMKMYSSVSIPINNGANAINALLLMDEKEYTMTFR